MAQSMVVIVGVTLLSFGAMFLTGDPVTLMVGQTNWTVEQIEAFRHEMGFDRPWWVQYLDFMGGVLRGDLGQSLHYRQDVAALIGERLPHTLQLTAVAVTLAVLVALPAGVVSAVRPNSLADAVSRVVALLGQSVPVFWLGLLFILVFAVHLSWLPVSGSGTWRHLVLPGMTLALYSMGRTMRMVRASLLEALHQDYIRTARAKGLSERVAVYKHALRNALVPVVTLLGLEVGTLLGGAVLTEQVFSWPGLGRLIVQAIWTKDFPVVQGGVTLLALLFVGINLLVDILYGVIDPRIRYG